MKRAMAIVFAVFVLAAPPRAHADTFGADVAVLMKILAENIKQLIELENIVKSGNDSLALMREINRGINDSLKLMRTISPYIQPGAFSDLKSAQDVLRKFNEIYGSPVESPDRQAQSSVDQSIAEAVAMNSAIYDYTKEIDRIGEEIKSYSHSVSPGGAQKLTAESLGVMIHILDQQLRAQGTLLKLNAQGLAQANKREKDYTAEYLKASNRLTNAMQSASPKFERPRF